MIRDEDVLSLYPIISQLIDDRLQSRLEACLAARGLNLGPTDGAGEGELWSTGDVRTAGGLALGETGQKPPAGTLLAREQAGAPPTPPGDARLLYPKADGWYERSSGGVEQKLGGPGDWNTLLNKPATFPPSAHTHDDRYTQRTSANRPGVTRLYRNEDDSGYNVQTTWDGVRWLLRGYLGDSYHAPARVDYADNAPWSGVSGRPAWVDWTAWTPTWGGLSGTISSQGHRYMRLGGLVITHSWFISTGGALSGDGNTYLSAPISVAGSFSPCLWHDFSYNASIGGGIGQVNNNNSRIYAPGTFSVGANHYCFVWALYMGN